MRVVGLVNDVLRLHVQVENVLFVQLLQRAADPTHHIRRFALYRPKTTPEIPEKQPFLATRW